MRTFFSTFVSGLQEPVAHFLRRKISGVRIIYLLDGAIIYECKASNKMIGDIRFFNNSFIVLKTFENLKKEPIYEMMTTIASSKNMRQYFNNYVTHAKHTFRITASMENKLVSPPKKLLELIEKSILKVGHLKIDRAKPEIEFWFLYRSESLGFFLQRITRHTSYEKILPKGELRPELAHILCLLSKPTKSDIFLDPFCGYGAIPIERARILPFQQIFATDKDPVKIRALKGRREIRNMRGKFVLDRLDFLMQEHFPSLYFNKIVTDPPWGLYEDVGMNIRTYYGLMLRKMRSILKASGTMIILTARKMELESNLSLFKDELELRHRYDILVSGKKSAIYIITKASQKHSQRDPIPC